MIFFTCLSLILFSLYVTAQRSDLIFSSGERNSPEPVREDKLLDILLVATVDGKFHALNRTTGSIIWSMHTHPSLSSGSFTSSVHGEIDLDGGLGQLIKSPTLNTSTLFNLPEEDEEEDDLYIVEPQSGAIYLLQHPSSQSSAPDREPLKKLPYTIQQLVSNSPFVSSPSSPDSKDSGKVFVGKMETRLVVLELETGKIRGLVDPERCAWDEDFSSHEGEEGEEGVPPPKRGTEVFISRTDYRLQINSRSPSNNTLSKKKRRRSQVLWYSEYGPNKIHSGIQKQYTKTLDSLYAQGLPGGQLLAMTFKPPSKNMDRLMTAKQPATIELKWAHNLEKDVIATFDVISPSPDSPFGEKEPYILLQPRPKLEDVDDGTLMKKVSDVLESHGGSTAGDEGVGYVNHVNGALYVMSNDMFPFVIFGKPPRPGGGGGRSVPLIEGGSSSDAPAPAPPVAIGDEDDDDGACRRMDCLIGLRGRVGGSFMPSSGLGKDHLISWERRLIEGAGDLKPNNENAIPDFFADKSGGVSPASNPSSPSESSATSYTFPPSPTPTPVALYMSGRGNVWFVISSLLMAVLIGWAITLWKTSGHIFPWTTTEPAPIIAPVPPEYISLGHGAEEKKVKVRFAEVHTPVTPIPPPLPHAGAELLDPLGDTVWVDKEDAAAPTVGVVVVPSTPTPGSGETEEGAEEEDDAQGSKETPGRKRNRTRSKQKKRKTAALSREDKEKEDGVEAAERVVEMHLESDNKVTEPVKVPSSLLVSEDILGFGSHGTRVFKGTFLGRPVAVKRLLRDNVTLAMREVNLLQESDEHPNVIRYYFQEARNDFLYIALELCPASLADIVERPDNDQFREISCGFDPKRALSQITSGLRWLHGLKIVHRDIKPQNILVAYSKAGGSTSYTSSTMSSNTRTVTPKGAQFRMLISDFGLCKKLGADETSFLPTVDGAGAAGTVGWRAPEILRGDVKLDVQSVLGNEDSFGSKGSNGGSGGTSKGRTRLTKSVDVFALGCLFYYTLTSGGHPYGDRFEREVNIMRNVKDLKGLEPFGEEGAEAKDLIDRMLSPESASRPDTTTILLHPFFWTPGRRLAFLQEVSDRFEIMVRDPPEASLLKLEENAFAVVGNDWYSRLDKNFLENLGKFRKYDPKSVQDLLRAFRNKKHHYQDLPDHVKRTLGPLPDGFLHYFTSRFPGLFLHAYYTVTECGLQHESVFQSYFELGES